MDALQRPLFDRLRYDGSHQDWERFVHLYRPLLEQWARRLCPRDEAADLVQNVLVRVMEELSSFTGEGERSFLAWLRAVMTNRWRDLRRRAATRPVVNDPAAIEAAIQESDIAKLLECEDREFLVRRALQVMQSDFEPTTWRACWEHVAMDRRAADVAFELGVSEAVVYSASYRVIRRLRQELAGLWR